MILLEDKIGKNVIFSFYNKSSQVHRDLFPYVFGRNKLFVRVSLTSRSVAIVLWALLLNSGFGRFLKNNQTLAGKALRIISYILN